ncbi:bifunctional diaminohydroxyphosphoribosylaminopyrimidine deaminase/5-amino-6-(5-phosphoribosylamino)uracil reductase RibD [bacterium]|nr:bifunctional diaminohydroxyphosphoribosylaminopyrimidine deaminase/5-amino-6-(5-phosphoribosylamino)uracil reductase RibD [bacterium]
MKQNPIELMKLALSEALKGGRDTKPNPRVGAVLEAQSGEVVLGFHKKAGQPHAEIEVLNECRRLGINPKGAQIAVTLEPCSHQGRTGACSKALIDAGISKVIVGVRDPHKKVNGQGIAMLREAGIQVEESILAKECFELNREWLIAQKLGRPFVTLKMATSLDGKWAADNGESKWITGEEARNKGHFLRARVDAIGTSFKTITADNPDFTARPDSKLVDWQPRLFVFSGRSDLSFENLKVKDRNPTVVDLSQGLKIALEKLFLEEEISDLMIEAGPNLSTYFLNERLVDELWLFQAPVLLGGGGASLGALSGGQLPGLSLQLVRKEYYGQDCLLVLASA